MSSSSTKSFRDNHLVFQCWSCKRLQQVGAIRAITDAVASFGRLCDGCRHDRSPTLLRSRVRLQETAKMNEIEEGMTEAGGVERKVEPSPGRLGDRRSSARAQRSVSTEPVRH